MASETTGVVAVLELTAQQRYDLAWDLLTGLPRPTFKDDPAA